MVVFVLTFATILVLLWVAVNSLWVFPRKIYKKLRKNGFDGPKPIFPLGNISEIRQSYDQRDIVKFLPSSVISHDIHSSVFPYFYRWQSIYGKVFIYWLGTEPFLYTADPEFLRKMASIVKGKDWGKPTVFKKDRQPMFGNGLVMVEGQKWLTHRRVISLAFSPPNLHAMTSLMLESTRKMLDRWGALVALGKSEIDAEAELSITTGEIIARITFGLDHKNGREVFEKLRTMQKVLFSANRFVGVPFSRLVQPNKVHQAYRLGKDIDRLILSIIKERKEWDISGKENVGVHKDLLGAMLQGNKHSDDHVFSERELLDECKTFFFGGHETTALLITWTLLVLAAYPTWQDQLREEVKQVVGDNNIIDANMLSKLTKMRWVQNEVLRLYSPAPNAQRQSREDISIENNVIPKGTNIWIDVVSMHHDKSLWGDDVMEFKPQRFQNDPLYGGCKHKMGFLPFGFGGRMCVGRNLSMMEYKIILSQILTQFSFSVSSNYIHSPVHMLSLRPTHGLPLIFKSL
ncbi:cytokinin hydroxylase-like [Impatiens glandulifera]|uniref:cytokinin hydroxylase-like n=1 Tax=Impatiens glandulifera TaxID=253017 RepID=UPI001FB1476D|nr:cytokinin hydroxylase-like [Impatiens glandulifera]